MKLALTLNVWADEDLVFAQQFGVNDVLAQAVLPPDGRSWDEQTLAALRHRVEQSGLTLLGVDRLPCPLRHTVPGVDGRDGEIAAVCAFIQSAGAAGIPLITYRWSAQDELPRRAPDGRGQAAILTNVMQRDTHDTPDSPAWDPLSCFLERVLPVAERAGVKLACQPDNPLDPAATGLLRTVDALEHLLALVPGSSHGLDLNHAAIAGERGAGAAIQRLCRGGKVFLAQVQQVSAGASGVAEGFLDEGGMLRILQAYHAAGFEGALRPAPPPGIAGDSAWGHKGHAFHVGYLKALLQVVARRAPDRVAAPQA